MSVYTTELPAGTTAGDLCGCSCPDAIVEGCTDPMAFNYDADANTDDGSCCMGTGVDQDALVASLVAAVSQGAVTVNGCADGLPTLNGLLGVECSTDMSVYTTELPAGTTAGDLCGCTCPDPVPTCDDGIQNGDEEDVDCGGSLCDACEVPCDGTEVSVI